MYIINRCAKYPSHAYSRGSGGMPPRKILKCTCQESKFGDFLATKIICIRHINALVLEQKSLHRNATLPLKYEAS